MYYVSLCVAIALSLLTKCDIFFRRKNTPHYKRDLTIDPSMNMTSNLLDAIPNLDLSSQPEVHNTCSNNIL